MRALFLSGNNICSFSRFLGKPTPGWSGARKCDAKHWSREAEPRKTGCSKKLVPSGGKKIPFRKILITALVFFFLSLPVFAQGVSSVISIDSADKTEYRKNPVTGYEEIVLSGAVSISVSQGSTKTTITASSITYTRATDMLFANGGVTLKQTGGSAGEQNVQADTLLFNTATLEGVFDNGRVIQTQSDAINLPSGSKLIVASDIFGRDSSNTIAFKNADLTFCDDENPHWKIWASRIWLLPGGEFAFANAVFSVGRVPLLWLPAFYYPKDDFVFNPYFGYNERTGYYMQTTTYIFGRRPLDTSSGTSSSSSSSSGEALTAGLFNFMRSSSLKEQVREGLVLHNLDTDFKGNTTNYLKVKGDLYMNLGGMMGLEGVYKPSSIISNLEGGLNIGFSNTVFKNNGVYVPIGASGNTYYDSSNFLGFQLPFRYSGNLKLSMSKPFSLTVSLPIYSDPYFKEDFDTRSEYLDWIGFLLSSTKTNTETSNQISSFTWNVNASYSVPLPAFIKPYISTFNISSVTASVAFNSRAATFSDLDSTTMSDNWKSYTPNRYFFSPSQVNPFNFSSSISGTLVSIGGTSSSSSKKKTSVTLPLALDAPEEFVVEEKKTDGKTDDKPADKKDGKPDGKLNEKPEDESSEEENKNLLEDSALPELSIASLPSSSSLGGLKYTLTYSITPQVNSQISYDASKLYIPEDFDWSNFQSTYLQLKAPVSLNSSLSYRDSFASMTNSFSFTPVYQAHPKTNNYTESSLASLQKTDYNARKLDLVNTNKISFRPFVYTTAFKNTGIDWNTTTKLVETKFLGDADDWQTNPQWRYITAWDYIFTEDEDLDMKNFITSHTLSGTLAASEGDFSQTLTLSTTLPPQNDKYNATLKLVFPYVSLSFASGIEATTTTTSETDVTTWKKNPFQQSASVKLFKGTNALSLTQSLNYNLEDSYWDSFKLSLSWRTLSLSYTMSYTYGYDFDSDSGWVQKTDKDFLPYNVSLSYSTPSKTFYQWKNRIKITPSLSTSLVYDCLRPTSSYFRFVPSLTFAVNDFVNLTFSAESRNGVIFRYVQDYLGYPDVISGEKNVLVDLLNSFAFWGDDSFIDPDQVKRKSSGFKMKSLNVTLTHNLHDWDFSTSLTFKPRLETTSDGKKEYNYHPYFTLGVVWRPMSALKTNVVDEYGTWKLNP